MKFLDNKQYEYDDPFSATLMSMKNAITENSIWHNIGLHKDRWVDKLNGIRRREYIMKSVNANKTPDDNHVELNSGASGGND